METCSSYILLHERQALVFHAWRRSDVQGQLDWPSCRGPATILRVCVKIDEH